ncbi:MAG: GntR family transcriptional regulator [Stellaceae bacterium]
MSDLISMVVVELRKMIMNGGFGAGERVAEVPLADRLRVSRTPVRSALSILEQEGLLAMSPTGGYTVRSFTLAQIADAIDVRGALEGLAARQLAEHGLSRHVANGLRACVELGDELISAGKRTPENHGRYAEMNQRFHTIIVEASGNAALARALKLNDSVPFSSANAVVSTASDPQEEFHRMVFAQFQHRYIFQALENGEGMRAEELMREHANRSKEVVARMRERNYDATIPGGRLIEG